MTEMTADLLNQTEERPQLTREQFEKLPPHEQIRYLAEDPEQHLELMEFLSNTFKFIKIDGHEIIQTKEGLFVEHVVIDQDYFNDNWLTQFAIGTVGGKNYFNMDGWSSITDGFVKGAIIVDKDKNYKFVIPKFVGLDLSFAARSKMLEIAHIGDEAKHIPDPQRRARAQNTYSAHVINILNNDDHGPRDLPSCIPEWYYKEHNVSPDTMQQVIYIRDTYKFAGNDIEPDGPVMERIKKVLYKWNTTNKASADDKKFIMDITNNEFSFDYEQDMVAKEEQDKKVPDAPETTQPEVDEDFDPLG